MSKQIDVYVLRLGAYGMDQDAAEAAEEFIRSHSAGYQKNKIRVYTTDYFVQDRLRERNLYVPWIRTFLTEKEDNLLFKRAASISDSWLAHCDRTTGLQFRGQSSARLIRDDLLRRMRDLAAVNFIWQKDSQQGSYDVHLIITTFPHLDKVQSPLIHLKQIKTVYPKGSLKERVKSFIYDLSVFTIQHIRPAVWICRQASKLWSKQSRVSPLREDSQIKGHRFLFTAGEVVGGKNVLEPLLQIIRSIPNGTEFRVLVDNPYSADYLSAYGQEATLIRPAKNGGWKMHRLLAAFLMRSIAMELFLTSGEAERAALYLGIASIPFFAVMNEVLYRIDFCDSFIQDFKPTAALAYPEEAYSCLATLQACKGYTIPTMTYLQCIIADHELYNVRTADKLAIYGTQGTEMLRKLGFPEEYWIYTGNPKLDRIPNRDHNEDFHYVKQLLTDWVGQPLLLLATHLLVSDSKVAVENLLSALSENQGRQFYTVIKMHPDDIEEDYVKIITENALGLDLRLLKNCDLYALLHMADIVVTGYSTVGAEAAMFDKPLMTLNFSGLPHIVDYAGEGIAIEVSNKAKIMEVLLSLLNDHELRQQLAAGRKSFIERYAFKMDGHAGDRIIEAMTQLSSSRA